MKNPVLNIESFLADTWDLSYFNINSDESSFHLEEYKVINHEPDNFLIKSVKGDDSNSKDSYKPQRTRGTKELKEGYCEECKEWFRLKNSSYWYHMNFKHGISSKGIKYPNPEFRRHNGKIEGFCETCDQWIILGYKFNESKNRFGWYRHCQKLHK